MYWMFHLLLIVILAQPFASADGSISTAAHKAGVHYVVFHSSNLRLVSDLKEDLAGRELSLIYEDALPGEFTTNKEDNEDGHIYISLRLDVLDEVPIELYDNESIRPTTVNQFKRLHHQDHPKKSRARFPLLEIIDAQLRVDELSHSNSALKYLDHIFVPAAERTSTIYKLHMLPVALPPGKKSWDEIVISHVPLRDCSSMLDPKS